MKYNIKWTAICSFFVLAGALTGSGESQAWSDDVFEQYLLAGKWSEHADDNALGETLPFALVRDIVKRYCQSPTDKDALENMGIVALAVGVANWGISEPNQLPEDPNKKKWSSTTGPDAGKHLMSYAIGGVGISHADVEDLKEFLQRLAARETFEDRKKALERLVNEVKYKHPGVVYDELRASGVCAPSQIDVDLNGLPFEHLKQSATRAYCNERRNRALRPTDWQLFRTVARNALRRRDDQAWLLALWMRSYWEKSLAQVTPGAGYIEEVMVNARIRNSSSSVAAKAIARNGASPEVRIQSELLAYGNWNTKTLNRRRGTMMRPVVLYRAISTSLKSQNIQCP
jgi:hypothetical protein